MKFNHQTTVLWDEVHILSRGDSPFQFPSALISQMPVQTQVDKQFVTNLWLIAISTCLSAEMAPMFFLLFFSLDY
jgi:hypothetical protein